MSAVIEFKTMENTIAIGAGLLAIVCSRIARGIVDRHGGTMAK